MHESTKITGFAALAAAVLLVPGCKKSPPAEPPRPPAAEAPAPPAGPPADAHGGAAADPHGSAAADPHGSARMQPPPLDDAGRAVLAYQVTLPKAEAYCTAIKELRAAGEKDEKLMARLRAPKPPGDQQAELSRWLEAIPPLKAILDRHGLKGLDLVLMPQALMQGRVAYAKGREGSEVPLDRINASSLALHKAEWEKMDPLVSDCMANLRVISGH